MKKIAYIELDTHAEIAANFMDLLSDSEEISVDYYFSNKILNQLQISENQNIKKSDSQNIIQQLNQKHYDLVIIGTVHRYFNTFYKITQQQPTAILVHNLNFAKISAFQLLKNIWFSDVIFRLKLLIKEGFLLKNKVYNNAKQLLVLDKSMVNIPYKFLPLFYTKKYENNTKNSIVIPGEVSQKRRDYAKIFRILKQINDLPECPKNMEFVFLGKASGRELIDLQTIEPQLKNISVTYFTEKVPQPKFDEIMQNAKILWCPLQSENYFFDNQERYGITKMSGNIGDAIRYGKMAIFPAHYPSEKKFIIAEPEHISDWVKIFNNDDSWDFQNDFSEKRVKKELHTVLHQI